MAKSKFSTSYGLVVKTSSNGVVVLRRKIPYCVQDFFLHLSRKKGYSRMPVRFPAVRTEFEKEWVPRLEPHEVEDYRRFLTGAIIEDEYDFPHGQFQRSKKCPVNLYTAFFTAYREFQEESGFHFTFSKRDIPNYPLVLLRFRGLDSIQYSQYYFIVENVKGLRRHSYFNSFNVSFTAENQIQSWKDDRLIYHGEMVPVETAYEKFLKQQELKYDMKHLLCAIRIEKIDRRWTETKEKENSCDTRHV
ncbi:hypothetical protein AVEN_261774-1 [Araneus ventricosus]|uniref:Uncharacterized protein n=1 Tax=Araneus ventricosus TaxID=182803 RepID=A0A4Y2LXZ3_ARAVE|nr:hypothetical protein AVEN_261774-1 [Araneus ventricosus]